jgi:putative effector of murein hydrolase
VTAQIFDGTGGKSVLQVMVAGTVGMLVCFNALEYLIVIGSLIEAVDEVKAFGADKMMVASLAPKSVTTPIAISLAEKDGGVPALTTAFVVICGIFGGVVGPIILRKMGIKSKIAQGLAMGSASHALGTARAMEMGALEGAISGLAIGIMGIMTALLIPFAEMIF